MSLLIQLERKIYFIIKSILFFQQIILLHYYNIYNNKMKTKQQ